MFFAILLVFSQPTLKLPQEIKGAPGQFIAIRAETDCKAVKYVALDEGLNVFPSALLADPKSTVVTSVTQGKFRLLAYTAAGDQPSDPVVVSVVVGNPKPIPPSPVPPAPPSPPDNSFMESLQSIYAAIQEPNRESNKLALSEVYRQASTLAQDKNIKTIRQLFMTIREGSKKVISEDALVSLRERIQQELSSKFPQPMNSAITDELRADFSMTFSRIAGILEQLK